MKTTLLFDFIVDKKTNSVFVNKEFEADRSLVWDAFTKQEILDQWWAPKPWESKTTSMDFTVGGKRICAMVGTEGQEQWSIQEFKAIRPETHFEYFDAFTDKEQHISNEFPSSEWNLNFSEDNGITTVKVIVKHKSASDLEKILETGFQDGFTQTLNALEQLLKTLSKR